MFQQRVLRVSGLIALAAGAFWAAYEIGEIAGLVPLTLDPRLDLIAHSFVGLAAIGIYARVAERAGVFGLIGSIAYMLMVLVNTSMKTIYTIIVPVLSSQYPEAGMAVGATVPWNAFTAIWFWLTILGPILFGVVLIYSRQMPRWASALLVIGPIVSLTIGPALVTAVGLSGNPGALISAVGWAWLGYASWSELAVEPMTQQPAAVAA